MPSIVEVRRQITPAPVAATVHVGRLSHGFDASALELFRPYCPPDPVSLEHEIDEKTLKKKAKATPGRPWRGIMETLLVSKRAAKTERFTSRGKQWRKGMPARRVKILNAGLYAMSSSWQCSKFSLRNVSGEIAYLACILRWLGRDLFNCDCSSSRPGRLMDFHVVYDSHAAGLVDDQHSLVSSLAPSYHLCPYRPSNHLLQRQQRSHDNQ